MTIVFLIILLETLVLALWMITRYWRSRQKRALSAAVPVELKPNSSGGNATPASRDAGHWQFINKWHATDQADDRRPVDGAVRIRAGSPPERRSLARRSHQA